MIEARSRLKAMGEDMHYQTAHKASVWNAARDMIRFVLDQRAIRDTLVSMIGTPDERTPQKNMADSPCDAP